MDRTGKDGGDHTGDVGAESSTVTAGVDGSVDPEDAALDNLRDRRPGVFGDGVPVPSLVDQGVRGEDNVGRMSSKLTPFLATLKMWRCAFVAGAKPVNRSRSAPS